MAEQTGSDDPPEARVPLPPEDDGTPWFTWVVGASALVVAGTAAMLFLSGPEPAPEAESSASAPPAESAPPPAPDPLTARPALDLTAQLLDARQRAQLWRSRAALASIRVVIDAAKPVGAVEFDFGVPKGQSLPGAPLEPARMTYAYQSGSTAARESSSSELERALPEPNCPLEVAFRTLSQAGIDTSGRLGATYLHSAQHGRPIWTFTRGEDVHKLDADTCAVLRR
jgi:hypothetical protein